MKTAAIIVCYNGQHYIEKCIKNLHQDKAVSNIILIDNNSSDNSVAIVKGQFTDVKIIALKKNVGFGLANNIGLKLAVQERCDYFFLINQDVYIEADTVYGLIQAHKINKDFGILAPIQLNGEGNGIDVKFYDYLFCQNKEVGYKLLKNELSSVLSVNFVNAAAWLISKDCLMKVGGFDPIFFHTGEDDEYVQRVNYWGYKVGILPNVSVRHDRPQVCWQTQETGLGRQITLDFLTLKDINRTFNKSLLYMAKKKFYYIASDIAKLKLESAKIKLISFIHVLKLTKAIKESRRRGQEQYAFLRK